MIFNEIMNDTLISNQVPRNKSISETTVTSDVEKLPCEEEECV